MSPATQASELIHLEFDDNKLLPALYGEHDRNLARLEQALQVAIASRGNRLAISGPLDSVEAARSALTILYDRLRRGLRVSVADVDGAIRLAIASASRAEPQNVSGISIQGRNHRKWFSPRSQIALASLLVWGAASPARSRKSGASVPWYHFRRRPGRIVPGPSRSVARAGMELAAIATREGGRRAANRHCRNAGYDTPKVPTLPLDSGRRAAHSTVS